MKNFLIYFKEKWNLFEEKLNFSFVKKIGINIIQLRKR